MKTVVFGGNGYLGGHLVEQLQSAGHQVTVAVRSTSDTGFLSKLGVPVVKVDFSSPESITQAIAGHPVVYHCIANTRLHQSLQARREVEVALTRRIIEAAARANVTRWVQLSTIEVYGETRSDGARPSPIGRDGGKPISASASPHETTSSRPRMLDETDPCRPAFSYQVACLEREDLVRRAGQAAGLEVVVLQPAGALGRRYRLLANFIRAHQAGNFPTIGGGTARFSAVDPRDIGRAMVFLGGHPDAAGQSYLVKGFDTSWREVKGVLDQLTGRTTRLQNLPKPVAQVMATLMEWFTPYSREPMLTRFVVWNSTTPALFDDSKLRRAGFAPRYQLTDALADALAWFDSEADAGKKP